MSGMLNELDFDECGESPSGAHHDDAVHAAGLDQQGERLEHLRARPGRGEVCLDESPVFPARYCR